MTTHKLTALTLQLLILLILCRVAIAQGTTRAQSAQQSATPAPSTDAQNQNIQEYIELLRSDVRQEKAVVMSAVMQLDIDQAAKFWPIYNEYDAELTKLNKENVANVLDYADNYDQMTDAKADELVQKAIDLRNGRSALLAKCYGRVKAVLGALEAARFAQVENQLLLLIDLQIASSLPIIQKGS